MSGKDLLGVHQVVGKLAAGDEGRKEADPVDCAALSVALVGILRVADHVQVAPCVSRSSAVRSNVVHYCVGRGKLSAMLLGGHSAEE